MNTTWLDLAPTREQFAKLGFDAQSGTPEDFASFFRDDSAAAARIVRDVNIKAA